MQSNSEKKYRAARRAQYALEQRLDRIDFEDELEAEVKKLFPAALASGQKTFIEIETVSREDQDQD